MNRFSKIFGILMLVLFSTSAAYAKSHSDFTTKLKNKKHVATAKKPVVRDRMRESYSARVQTAKKKNSSRLAHSVKKSHKPVARYSQGKVKKQVHPVAKHAKHTVKKKSKQTRQATQHNSWEQN